MDVMDAEDYRRLHKGVTISVYCKDTAQVLGEQHGVTIAAWCIML